VSEMRRFMFPYGMSRNSDGSWTLFNRQYKPVGVVDSEWADWDDPRHKMKVKGLGPATLAKLDYKGEGAGDRIYFYNDGCIPTRSSKDMKSYLTRLEILMKLDVERR
jgi:hypothetical protein